MADDPADRGAARAKPEAASVAHEHFAFCILHFAFGGQPVAEHSSLARGKHQTE
jgi:hypothetical protein